MAGDFYGREIYLIQTLMRGCFWYALCILTSFHSYQDGRGEFHPFRLLLIFPVLLGLWAIRTFIRKRKLRVFLLIAAATLLAVALPIPWYLFAVEVLLHLFAFYQPEKNLRKFGAFWETWLYWTPGVIVFLLLLFLHMLWTEDGSRQLGVSPSFAAGCMLVAFGVFLALNLINNYMKNFHEYFAGRRNVVEKEAFARAKRSNYTMISILLVVGAVVMFLFTFLPLGLYQALWKWIRYLFSRILGIAFSSMDQLGSRYDGDLDVGGDMTPSGSPDIRVAAESSGVGGQILGIILILGIVLGLAWLLIKFFKGVLANYHVGTDTAEFVSRWGEEEELYEKRGNLFFHKKFGNSNREKVRKSYYQTIVKRFGRMPEEKKRSIRTGQTPKEWSNLFADSPGDRERLRELTRYYEKARFGKEDSTQEEVEAVQELVAEMGRRKS